MLLLVTEDINNVLVYSCITALLLLWVAYPDRYVGTHPRPDLSGPTGNPLFGNLVQVFPWRYRFLLWLEHMHTLYGPLWTFTMPPWGRGIVINRPEWLSHVKEGARRIVVHHNLDPYSPNY